jgi:tRNA modification GTPase
MTPTLAAVFTPPGKSALATLALRGPRAWLLARELLCPRKSPLPPVPNPGRFYLGTLGKELRDEAVLAVIEAEPTLLEFHVHGGAQVTGYLLELLQTREVNLCSWSDLAPSEATLALSKAATLRTAKILLDQTHGAFHREIARLLNADDEELARGVDRLLIHSRTGLHLCEPFRVVIAGAPNVGKSSLVNALAGYTRSIVSPIAGTTRDIVTTRLAIDGWPIELADTAGLREGGETLESMGREQARAALKDADLVLWVLDVSKRIISPETISGRLFTIANKIDAPSASNNPAHGPRVSAKTGEGIEELCQFISRQLVPQPPEPGEAVPFLEKQVRILQEVGTMLAQGDKKTGRERLQLWSARQEG